MVQKMKSEAGIKNYYGRKFLNFYNSFYWKGFEFTIKYCQSLMTLALKRRHIKAFTKQTVLYQIMRLLETQALKS
jgi:hypothetical protein